MNYTLLIIWPIFKPAFYHSNNREFLETLMNDAKPCVSYIYKNTGCISRRIVECENNEINYL